MGYNESFLRTFLTSNVGISDYDARAKMTAASKNQVSF